MKNQIVSKRKGYGKIIKTTDYFGNYKYILLDNNENFIEENHNANTLLAKLWK